MSEIDGLKSYEVRVGRHVHLLWRHILLPYEKRWMNFTIYLKNNNMKLLQINCLVCKILHQSCAAPSQIWCALQELRDGGTIATGLETTESWRCCAGEEKPPLKRGTDRQGQDPPNQLFRFARRNYLCTCRKKLVPCLDLFQGRSDFRDFPQPQMIYEALTGTALPIKNNVSKSGIINSHKLLLVRLGYVSFLNLNVFHADLCSLFSFTYYWNFSWVFAKALTAPFKLVICASPEGNSGAIATLRNPHLLFPWHKALLCWAEELCPAGSSQAGTWDAARHLGARAPRAMASSGQRGTNQTCQHRGNHTPTAFLLRSSQLPGWAGKL